MPERNDRESGESNRRQLQGLPVIRRNVAGVDLGSERSLGVRSDAGWERSRNRQLRSDDAGIAAPGGVAESTSGRVGGNGKYGSLLDCSARDVRRTRLASLSGGYTATGASAGAGQENRSQRLRVDSAATQLRTAAGFVPTGGSGMHAANSGTG